MAEETKVAEAVAKVDLDKPKVVVDVYVVAASKDGIRYKLRCRECEHATDVVWEKGYVPERAACQGCGAEAILKKRGLWTPLLELGNPPNHLGFPPDGLCYPSKPRT